MNVRSQLLDRGGVIPVDYASAWRVLPGSVMLTAKERAMRTPISRALSEHYGRLIRGGRTPQAALVAVVVGADVVAELCGCCERDVLVWCAHVRLVRP